MVKVSACVITKNEEQNIVRWLDNMRKVTKDLIVVDTGSTDRTIELAKEQGARVYSFAWQNDFSAAKNFAIEKASGEWIIFLDADEYFTEETVGNVRKYIERFHRDPKTDVFVCKIINIDTDADDRPISEFYNLRIFRNTPQIRYTNAIHEELRKSSGLIQLRMVEKDIEIMHTGYSSNIIAAKLTRNLELIQQEISESGEQPRHYRYLCDCYYGLKDYEQAEKYARLSINEGSKSLGRDNNIHKRMIESMMLTNQNLDVIMEELENLCLQFPDDPELGWYKGELFFLQQKYVAAEVCFMQVLNMNETQTVDYGYTGLKGKLVFLYARLGAIYQKKNVLPQAVRYYTQALEQYKYSEEIFLALYPLLATQDATDIIQFLNTIYTNTKRDLVFLVKALGTNFLSKVHLYYWKMIEKYTIELEVPLAAKLLAAGNYEGAAASFADELQADYQAMLLGLFMSKDQAKIEQAKIILPEAYGCILSKLENPALTLLPKSQLIYDELQSELARMNGSPSLPKQQDTVAIKEEIEPICLANCREDLIAFIDENKSQQFSVLDVGCGYGATLLKIKEQYPEAKTYGIESDEKNAQIAKRYAQVIVGDIEKMVLPYEKNSFDYIIFGDSFARLYDPWMVLKQITPYLKPTGAILASVPNVMHWSVVQDLLKGNWSYQDKGILSRDHLRFFTFNEVVKLFERTGYKELKFDTVTRDIDELGKLLLDKLKLAGLVEDKNQLLTYQWLVKATKIDAAAEQLKQYLTEVQRKELSFLLRRIENDIDIAQNCARITQLCQEERIEPDYLVEFIDNTMFKKIKVLILLSTNAYQHGQVQNAISLLIEAYKKYPDDAELIYTLAFLLDLNKDRVSAVRLLRQFKGNDTNITNLLAELSEVHD